MSVIILQKEQDATRLERTVIEQEDYLQLTKAAKQNFSPTEVA